MTTQIVRAWSSNIAHIAGETTLKKVLTRCGRTLKNFQIGWSGETDCTRCGSADEFEQIREETRQALLEKEEKEEAANQERRARTNRRIEKHRQLMEGFEALLKENGVEIVEVDQRPAGGSIEFEVEGLKFKLSGNIF